MAITAVLFDLGDTLWHFPQLPPAQQIRTETMRRVGGLLQSWGVPLEGDLRFLGRDIRYGVEAADRFPDRHCAHVQNFGQVLDRQALAWRQAPGEDRVVQRVERLLGERSVAAGDRYLAEPVQGSRHLLPLPAC